jgi:mono/diheme cytochrome c family protein
MAAEPETHPPGGDSGVGVVLLVVAALAVTIVGVALAAWYGGESHAGASTVTVAGGSTQPATSTATAVDPAVAAGAHDFVRFACDQCHGDQGQGGVSPDVPALTTVAKSLTVPQMTDIIEHGLGESTNPEKPYMPVWHGIISKHQISDIVAYLNAGLPAVAGAEPAPVPADQGDAVAGSILYTNLGCVNCHGPNGLGGVPNPQSEDKVIPPLSGKDFRSEFDTPAKIRDVIVSGSVLGKPPIVSMPHWGGVLTDAEVNELIAYIGTLS